MCPNINLPVIDIVRCSQQEQAAENCYYSAQGEMENSTGKFQQNGFLSQPQNLNLFVSGGGQGQPVASRSSQQVPASRRLTPVLPRRMDKNQMLMEFMSVNDGDNISSSSVSGSSSLQTPVISNCSKDSSLSDDARNLPAGQQFAASCDFELDNDASSVKSMPGVASRRAHCFSETNLASSLSRQQTHRARHGNAAEAQPGCVVTNTAEYAQQLRRRSRSAENLSKRNNRQEKQDVWSTVDIDISGQQTNTSKLCDKPRSKSALGQRLNDGLPAAFNAIRLRPFRQQMNSVVVGKNVKSCFQIFMS